jgi:hypothetical protein
MIEVGTREVKTVYWIKVEREVKDSRKSESSGKSKDSMKLTLNCESIGSKRD